MRRRQPARRMGIATWLLVALSLTIQVGGLLGRPLLVAAIPSGSMTPALKPGDLAVVLPAWLAPAVRVGDIVVFRKETDAQWMIHRVVGGDATAGFITRGDANPLSDPGRVLRRDLAGVVPTWQDKPLRVPRLGLLSSLQGSVATPVLGGVALVAGICLLLDRVRPKIRWAPRLRRAFRAYGRQPPARPEAVLLTYLGAGCTVFVATLLPAWHAGSTERVEYEIVAQRHSGTQRAGQYLAGAVHTEEFPIRNPSPLPAVVVFRPEDPYMTYEPAWAVLPPRRQVLFTAILHSPPVGRHRSRLQVGVYLPMLPPVWLVWLARQHIRLAAVVNALAPALAVTVLAGLDRRCRTAVTRLARRVARAAF